MYHELKLSIFWGARRNRRQNKKIQSVWFVSSSFSMQHAFNLYIHNKFVYTYCIYTHTYDFFQCVNPNSFATFIWKPCKCKLITFHGSHRWTIGVECILSWLWLVLWNPICQQLRISMNFANAIHEISACWFERWFPKYINVFVAFKIDFQFCTTVDIWGGLQTWENSGYWLLMSVWPIKPLWSSKVLHF